MQICSNYKALNYLYFMAKKPKKKITSNNNTLDGFMKGLASQNSSSANNSKINPKIKIQATSGYQPIFHPTDEPFIYPEFGEFRTYQYQIAIQCVTHNTLVCLPTGLGKTYIASVLICNYYKWFPQGKIFFLAPTKPLVDQQLKSLYQFSSLINTSNIIGLTGNFAAKKRVQAYKQKRIFFCTPQTLENDLRQKRFNQKQIVLLIVDEAHKSTGNYAYANIVRILDKQVFGFRMIGLSATPGNDKDHIQQVIENLLISKLIVKSQDDPDIKKYLKNKTIETVFVQPSSVIRQISGTIDRLGLEEFKLLQRLGICRKSILNSRFGINNSMIFMIRQQIGEKNAMMHPNTKKIVYQKLHNITFLSRGKQAIMNSGYQTFINAVVSPLEKYEKQRTDTTRSLIETCIGFHKQNQFYDRLLANEEFKKILKMFSSDAFVINHPKLSKLSDILVPYFNSTDAIKKKSKVIIFAQFRITCFEIQKYLQIFPQIKSQMFFGQSKTTVEFHSNTSVQSTELQMTQKQQKNLIQRFKDHQLNTLISTSIGQEGLDIGEVDCIVCYDGGQNMVRSIQRRGRTGRKRDGKVYILLMEGKQSDKYVKVEKTSKQMKQLLSISKKFKLYGYNPAMFEQDRQILIKRITYDTPQPQNEKTKSKQGLIPDSHSRKSTKKKRSDQFQKTEEQSKQQLSVNHEDLSFKSSISNENQWPSHLKPEPFNYEQQQTNIDFQYSHQLQTEDLIDIQGSIGSNFPQQLSDSYDRSLDSIKIKSTNKVEQSNEKIEGSKRKLQLQRILKKYSKFEDEQSWERSSLNSSDALHEWQKPEIVEKQETGQNKGSSDDESSFLDNEELNRLIMEVKKQNTKNDNS